MELFQYDRPYIVVRGNYDNSDHNNLVKTVFVQRGYKPMQHRIGGMLDGVAGCEFKSKTGPHFTFEYDDWGTLTLVPDDPLNNELVDELHELADEIELVGSINPDPFYQDSHVSRFEYPPRNRITHK